MFNALRSIRARRRMTGDDIYKGPRQRIGCGGGAGDRDAAATLPRAAGVRRCSVRQGEERGGGRPNISRAPTVTRASSCPTWALDSVLSITVDMSDGAQNPREGRSPGEASTGIGPGRYHPRAVCLSHDHTACAGHSGISQAADQGRRPGRVEERSTRVSCDVFTSRTSHDEGGLEAGAAPARLNSDRLARGQETARPRGTLRFLGQMLVFRRGVADCGS